MKTEPITPALIEFGERPFSALYGDPYHARMGTPEQARDVFLQGNQLPQRWAGRDRFTVLETGFGLGHNFLATWAAWRDDPRRCRQLFFVSIERHPPRTADLARAHAASPLQGLASQLLAAWPPLTPNMHVIDFEGGAVQLLLALGDVAGLLPVLRAAPDAFFLDGFAPARNPQMWQPRVLKALGRMAAADATLASWNVTRELQQGLVSAGFEVQTTQGSGGDQVFTQARYAPRHSPRPATPPRAAMAHGARRQQAIVVGAGIAGASAARALMQAGLEVTVIDRQAAPAGETSGNPAGLFHGTVHADDGRHARLFRAAALVAQRDYAGAARGVVRLGSRPLAEMQSLLRRLNLPADYVQALDTAGTSALAGLPLPGPAWFYPGAGWLDAGAWVRSQLDRPDLRWIGGTAVRRLQQGAEGWSLYDANDVCIATAPIVVLANADGAAPLLAGIGATAWPLSHSRGQVTVFRTAAAQPLRRAVAGDGYAIPLDKHHILCGATRDDGAAPPADFAGDALRVEDHRHNLQRLQRLTGLVAPSDPAAWSGRAGWRLQAEDRLPIAGAVPLLKMPPGQRMDQVRLLPRVPGLFVLTALGARGLTLAPLLGRLVAAQATGAPWPLEQDLADAVDPARWLVRAARRPAAV